MRKRLSISIIGLLSMACVFGCALAAGTPAVAKEAREAKQADVAKSRQLIVWTSGDREVALKMVFMYTLNCSKRGWMDQVRLLVWGPSAKLLTEDEELQKYLDRLEEAGVELFACKGCADLYGIADELSALGIEVKYTGTMLADAQKDGWHVLTF